MSVNDKGSRQLKVFIASTAYDLRPIEMLLKMLRCDAAFCLYVWSTLVLIIVR